MDTEEFNSKNLNDLLDELELESEEEIDNMVRDWNIAECVICGDEINLETCLWIDGDPCCRSCG